MSFERYVAKAQGFRAVQKNCIALGKSRIGLGRTELPFEYVVIHYDKATPAIKFTAGTSGDGFKVTQDPKGKTKYLAALSFTKLEYLPKGLYERTNDKDWIFKLREVL